MRFLTCNLVLIEVVNEMLCISVGLSLYVIFLERCCIRTGVLAVVAPLHRKVCWLHTPLIFPFLKNPRRLHTVINFCLRLWSSSTYLDENKQLILAILDNQNLGKLSECAHFQARLQQNLMYLAAIADAQPQPPAMHAQFPANAVMQPGAHYLQHQQAQALTPQSLMGARSPMMYAQQSLSALQQQQALHSQLGVSPSGNNGLHMLHGEANLGPSGQIPSGSFPDFGRSSAGSGEGIQSAGRATTMEQRGAGKQDVTGRDVSASGSADVRGGTAGAQAGDGTEPLYLKGPEGDGN